MSGLRTTLVRLPPVMAARGVAGRAAAPLLRERIARGDHHERMTWVRRTVPGSLGQVPEEITGFAALAAGLQPVRVCEIGTLNGGTSLFLTGLAPTVRTYVGIDIEPHNAALVRALAPAAVDVTFLTGSSRDPAIVAQLAGRLGGEPLDVLFVDGDHEYAGVKADFLEFRHLVRPGGIVAFHDIVPDHRSRTGATDGPWAGGVPTFWKEVSARFPSHEFVASWEQDAYGIGVIEHDPAVSL